MSITLESIIGKTVLVGLSYYDKDGELLQTRQLSGKVVETDDEKGIAIKLPIAPEASSNEAHQEEPKNEHFVLPSSLSCWFKAPPGHYKNPTNQIDITDPDFLVTWDIHQKQEQVDEGDHQWWEWVPNTVSPEVGSAK